MTATAMAQETTMTVGYFNAQKCAIHVVISEFNVNLRLDPGRYIEDTHGRKINDPYFDRYKLLSKETCETPMPIIRMARPKAVEAARDGQAVRQITEFKLDAHGHRQPVMPQPKVGLPPSASDSPIKAFSMEEARRAGLIRKVREVPEDYGATDTSGLPPTNIPEIKIARDTAAPAKAAPLPVGANTLSDDSRTLRTAQARTAMQESMAAAAKAEPELANPLKNLPGPQIVTCLPSAEALAETLESLPEPQVLIAEPDPVPEPEPEPAPVKAAKPAPQPLPPRKKFVCAADGRIFDFRSQLEMHVKRKFPGMYDELMNPYPKEG